MTTQVKEIQLYVDEHNHCPFKAWIHSLKDLRGRTKIRARLNRLRMGNLGDHRSVGDGVSELRIDFGPGYRVYFGQEGSKIIILLCGGDKGTQQKDIALARDYWADYRRHRHD